MVASSSAPSDSSDSAAPGPCGHSDHTSLAFLPALSSAEYGPEPLATELSPPLGHVTPPNNVAFTENVQGHTAKMILISEGDIALWLAASFLRGNNSERVTWARRRRFV